MESDSRDYKVLFWHGLMQQSMKESKELLDVMIKEIALYEDSRAGADRLKHLGLQMQGNSRASISAVSHQHYAGIAAPPRKRKQILADNSVGNVAGTTDVEVVTKSDETILNIKCILKEHFLFRNLHDGDLEDMICQMKAEDAGPGDIIIQQGEYGDKFFIMEEGECDIMVNNIVVGSYKGGQSFGDLALIYNTPRAATIQATSDCSLWTLERAFFAKAKVTSNSNESSGLTKFLSKLYLFGAKTPFFADLGQDRLTQLCSALTIKEYEEGEKIIEQGHVGEDLFILYKGTVKVTETIESGEELDRMALGRCKVTERKDAEGNVVKRSKEWEGVIFGERSLIKKELRARNIVATNTLITQTNEVHKGVTVLSLHVKDFQALLMHKIKEMTDMNDFRVLQATSLFKQLSTARLNAVQHTMVKHTHHQGRRIETNSSDIFIVLDGLYEDPSTGKQYRAGDVLGDLGRGADEFAANLTCLTDEENRPSTAQVPRLVVIEHLNAQAFDPPEGSAPVAGEEEEEEEETGQKELKETARRRAESARIRSEELGGTLCQLKRLDELDTLQELGQGTFGTVFLGRHKATGRLVAMKALDKSAIVANKQEFCVEREARALQCFYHPFVADFFGVVVSPRKVTFMLEFVPGGELWSYLYSGQPDGEFGGLSVHDATLYAACIVLALEHIHSLGYCYRDLKPENLLIAGNGYLKIVDFGLAKEVPFVNPDNGEILYRTFTTCGTPEYMAPEIILTSGYDKSADFWALGVLFYEMLCRNTPFDSGGNNKATFEKICRPTLLVNFPLHFPSHCKVFIRKLLWPNAALRLGNLQNGFKDIYDDFVFSTQNVDFGALLRKETPMTFVPTPFSAAEAPLDLSLFDSAELPAAEESSYAHATLFNDLLSEA